MDHALTDRLRFWFHDVSLREILLREQWRVALKCPSVHCSSLYAWETAQSRRGILMNLFCCPGVWDSSEVKDIFECHNLFPSFAMPAPIEKRNGTGDQTAIDVAIDDVFLQASLAETGFTEQRVEVVEKYVQFGEVFQVSELPQQNGNYLNFRVIRNLLAAFQFKKRHILLCDLKRPDLAESYQATVSALKDETFSSQCRIVYWQDLLRVIDPDLRSFVNTRFKFLS